MTPFKKALPAIGSQIKVRTSWGQIIIGEFDRLNHPDTPKQIKNLPVLHNENYPKTEGAGFPVENCEWEYHFDS